jgi:cephalosporin hydroxylase
MDVNHWTRITIAFFLVAGIGAAAPIDNIFVRLKSPRGKHKSGDGNLFVQPEVLRGTVPDEATWCVTLLPFADVYKDREVFENRVCLDRTGPLLDEIGLRLNDIPSGVYRLYLSFLFPNGFFILRYPKHVQAEYPEIEILDEEKVTTDYHVWYSDRAGMPGADHPTFLGVPVQKSLTDLWVFQEILWELKPRLVIEFGTLHGGSALYLSNTLRNVLAAQVGNAHFKVLTVDYDSDNIHPRAREDENIHIMTSSSISERSERVVKELLSNASRVSPAIVFLDSMHTKEHVLREMEMVSKYMKRGDYLVVEDTHHNYHPIGYSDNFGDGPFEAVNEFDERHPDMFIHDKKRETKFGFSWNVNGYLIKAN